MLQISATVHRYVTGLGTLLALAVAAWAAIDPNTIGITPEAKSTVTAILAGIVGAVNLLRSKTDPV